MKLKLMADPKLKIKGLPKIRLPKLKLPKIK